MCQKYISVTFWNFNPGACKANLNFLLFFFPRLQQTFRPYLFGNTALTELKTSNIYMCLPRGFRIQVDSRKKLYNQTLFWIPPPVISKFEKTRADIWSLFFFQDAEFFLWVTDEIRFCGGVFLYFYDCLFVFLAWDQIFWPRRLRFLKFCCWFTDPELARMSADWQFCQSIRGSFKIEKCSKPSNCIPPHVVLAVGSYTWAETCWTNERASVKLNFSNTKKCLTWGIWQFQLTERSESRKFLCNFFLLSVFESNMVTFGGGESIFNSDPSSLRSWLRHLRLDFWSNGDRC